MNPSQELINLTKLQQLINNFDRFKKPTWTKEVCTIKLNTLKKLYQKSKKTGLNKVSYKYGKGKTCGRKYVNGVGLQSLPKHFKKHPLFLDPSVFSNSLTGMC